MRLKKKIVVLPWSDRIHISKQREELAEMYALSLFPWRSMLTGHMTAAVRLITTYPGTTQHFDHRKHMLVGTEF